MLHCVPLSKKLCPKPFSRFIIVKIKHKGLSSFMGISWESEDFPKSKPNSIAEYFHSDKMMVVSVFLLSMNNRGS